MKRYQKVLLASCLAILAVIGSIQIYFTFSLDTQLRQLVENRFHNATNKAYKLDIADFDLRIWGRQLELKNITLTKKEDHGDTDIRATVDRLSISGVRFFPLFWNQKLEFKEIWVNEPKLYLTAGQSASNTNFKWAQISRQLSDITLQIVHSISIPKLYIRGLAIDFNRADLSINPYFALSNSNITLSDIRIDSSSLNDNRILPSQQISGIFRNVRYQTPKGLYKLSLDEFSFASQDSTVKIKNIDLQPRYNNKKFAEQSEYEINRISLNIPTIEARKIDPLQLNKANGITAQKIQIRQPDLDMFKDKHAPSPPNRQSPMPQQMLRGIPFPLDIDSLSIENGNVKYSQLNPRADTTGYILFTDLNADFTSLSNLQNESRKMNPPTLSVQTNVMDSAHLQVQFKFPMDGLDQHISGQLEPMDMRAFNNALKPIASVRVDKGQILGMNFDMILNKQEASGKVTLRYRSLKISLLDKKSHKENFGKKMKSLLANTIKIKSKNTGKTPRIGKVDFKRIERKAVFNYWWKSLLSGLKPSVGL